MLLLLTHQSQLGLILQIVAKAGPVPWAELNLPEGRTQKACTVMLDKEKKKVKEALEAAGEDAGAGALSPKVCLKFKTYLRTSLTRDPEAQGR